MGSSTRLLKVIELVFLMSSHTVDGRNPAPPGMYKTL